MKHGTVSVTSYGSLLARLYGFHRPFERAANTGFDRGDWLRQDLAALGWHTDVIDGIPLCLDLPVLATPSQRLGALYVIEGSALGGLTLSKGLDGLLAPGTVGGRRFFRGRGRGTALAWNEVLARLAMAETAPATHAETISAAARTFAVFEAWLAGWETSSHE